MRHAVESRERLSALAQQVDTLSAYARLARLRYDNGYTSYMAKCSTPSARYFPWSCSTRRD